MNRLAEIETFVVIAEAGSFAAAAERRGTAVSAVSRRLNDLESRLGTELAERTNRGLKLNSNGREYYRQCVRLLADIDAMDNRMASESNTDSGLIRIAIPRAFGLSFLAPVLNEYAAARPGIQFEVDVNDGFVDILEGDYDFAVRIGEAHDEMHFNSIDLVPVHYKVSASPVFWRQYGLPSTPSDLDGFPALAYRMGIESAIWQFTDPDGRKGSVKLAPRYVSNNGELLVKAAIDGLGVIMEPTFVCGEAIEKGELAPVLENITWFESVARIIHATNKPPGRCALAFMEFLVEKSKR